MTAVMLLALCEMVMADDGERVGCLVNWTPQAFTRDGQMRGGITGIAYGDRGWDANRTYRQLTCIRLSSSFAVYQVGQKIPVTFRKRNL